MPRLLYTLLLYLLLPFTPIKLWWRGRLQPEYRQHISERYGYYQDQVSAPVIWLHCVSVGETRGAAPLIQALQQRYPQHRILLTHATPTGRQASQQLFGSQVSRAYLPYDVPGAVQRFLQHYRPVLGVLMETELWFNLIAACRARHTPLLLLNARLSARSAAGYARVPGLTRPGLQQLSTIAAQTDADAQRFRQLGALAPSVMGNLKFDVMPPADAAQQGLALRNAMGTHRPVFLAASTREGEEALILDAVAQAAIPDLLTVLVPRHPQRFDEVAELLRKRRITYVRRSQLGGSDNTTAHPKGMDTKHVSVVLGDSMGEMFNYYAACDVAFIGGSLLPLGGQNLIEASAMSKPVLIGPHTFNFSQASELAIAAGAAWRVKDSQDLGNALRRLFGDVEKRQRMSLAALAFSNSAGGATARSLEVIAGYLPVQVREF